MTFCVTITLKIDGIVHDSGNAKTMTMTVIGTVTAAHRKRHGW